MRIRKMLSALILLSSLTLFLTACGSTSSSNIKTVENAEYIGNTSVTIKYTKEIALFREENGELFHLFWEDGNLPEIPTLEVGKKYKVMYYFNDNYTTYLTPHKIEEYIGEEN